MENKKGCGKEFIEKNHVIGKIILICGTKFRDGKIIILCPKCKKEIQKC